MKTLSKLIWPLSTIGFSIIGAVHFMESIGWYMFGAFLAAVTQISYLAATGWEPTADEGDGQ
jgi:hypothetical protein